MIEAVRDEELAGVEVALTGRLASMSHDEAEALVRAAGGRLVSTPTERTALLVVGRGRPALGPDGRPTASLRRGRALQARGTGLRIVGEEQLLARLGLADGRTDLRRLYSAEQLARILGTTRQELRRWARQGLVQPARVVNHLELFDFGQVAAARALSELTASGVPLRRIRRSLRQLAAWMPDGDRLLSRLHALGGRDELVVDLGGGRLADPDGQLRLPFPSPGPPAASASARGAPARSGAGRAQGPAPAPAAGRGATPRTGGTAGPAGAPPSRAVISLAAERRRRQATRARDEAEVAFERGTLAEEEGRLADAVTQYERALAAGGPRAELCFNLGNALYLLERREDAVARLAEAARADPSFVEAWNNLGNVLAELGRADEAVDAYRRALAVAPAYADAHFNLAETLAAQGDVAGARRHWGAYLEQDPHSTWAAEVRRRLEESASGGDDASGS